MVAFIKKIFSILFVSYDLCACCNFDSKLYVAYEWVSRESYSCQLATDTTSIFQGDSKNSNSCDVDASGFKQRIVDCFKELNGNINDTSGFKLDIVEFTACVSKNRYRYFFLLGDGIPCIFVTSNQGRNESRSRPLLVYYGGNADTIFDFCINFNVYGGSGFWKKIVQEYDILCPSLPGYFLNHTGDFSETTRLSQIGYVSAWCQKYYQDNVYILGFSLGCHFAILLAARGNCKFLFLSNPFLTDKTAARWAVGNITGCCGCLVSPLYKSKLDNGEKIKQVKCPIDFYYSLNDTIVNPEDANTLYDIALENGNNQVSLLPHGQRLNQDSSASQEENRFWTDIVERNPYCMPIKSLYEIIDASPNSYRLGHGEFVSSDVLRSRFAVG